MTQSTVTPKVRILLIEDNPADVDLLRRALAAAHLDCELTLLEDGAEALSFIRRMDSGGGPTKTMPASWHAAAKSALSERNP